MPYMSISELYILSKSYVPTCKEEAVIFDPAGNVVRAPVNFISKIVGVSCEKPENQQPAIPGWDISLTQLMKNGYPISKAIRKKIRRKNQRLAKKQQRESLDQETQTMDLDTGLEVPINHGESDNIGSTGCHGKLGKLDELDEFEIPARTTRPGKKSKVKKQVRISDAVQYFTSSSDEEEDYSDKHSLDDFLKNKRDLGQYGFTCATKSHYDMAQDMKPTPVFPGIGRQIKAQDLIDYRDVVVEFDEHSNMDFPIVTGHSPFTVLGKRADFKSEAIFAPLGCWAPEKYSLFLWHICSLRSGNNKPIQLERLHAKKLVSELCFRESLTDIHSPECGEIFTLSPEEKEELLDALVLLICLRDPIVLIDDIFRVFRHLPADNKTKSRMEIEFYNFTHISRAYPILYSYPRRLSVNEEHELEKDLKVGLSYLNAFKKTFQSLTNSVMVIQKAQNFHGYMKV